MIYNSEFSRFLTSISKSLLFFCLIFFKSFGSDIEIDLEKKVVKISKETNAGKNSKPKREIISIDITDFDKPEEEIIDLRQTLGELRDEGIMEFTNRNNSNSFNFLFNNLSFIVSDNDLVVLVNKIDTKSPDFDSFIIRTPGNFTNKARIVSSNFFISAEKLSLNFGASLQAKSKGTLAVNGIENKGELKAKEFGMTTKKLIRREISSSLKQRATAVNHTASSDKIPQTTNTTENTGPKSMLAASVKPKVSPVIQQKNAPDNATKTVVEANQKQPKKANVVSKSSESSINQSAKQDSTQKTQISKMAEKPKIDQTSQKSKQQPKIQENLVPQTMTNQFSPSSEFQVMMRAKFGELENNTRYPTDEEWIAQLEMDGTKTETRAFSGKAGVGSISTKYFPGKAELKFKVLDTSGNNNNCGFNSSLSSDNTTLFNSANSRRTQVQKLIEVVTKVQGKPAEATPQEWRIFYFVCRALRAFWGKNEGYDRRSLSDFMNKSKIDKVYKPQLDKIFIDWNNGGYDRIPLRIAETNLPSIFLMYWRDGSAQLINEGLFHALAELQERSFYMFTNTGYPVGYYFNPDAKGIIFIKHGGHHYSKLCLVDDKNPNQAKDQQKK